MLHRILRRIRLTAMFCALLLVLPLAAQEYIAQVQHYSVENGLSHRQVNAIFQDSRGFVWIGTPNGLNRFDGYAFRHYTKEKDGLPFNYIQEIAEDADGWLWLVEEGQKSVCLFHPDRGEVRTLEERFGKTDSVFARDKFLHRMICDVRGAVWLSSATINRLYRYHPATGVQVIPAGEIPGKIWPAPYIGNETLWLTTDRDYIVEIDQSGKVLRQLENVWLYGDWSLTDAGILALTRKPAAAERLVFYNLQGEALPERLPNLHGIPGPRPALVFPFDDKGAYVVHDRLIDTHGKTLAQWTFAQHDRNNHLWRCFFKDKTGRFWIGDDFGFYTLQIKKNRFQHYFFQKNAKPNLGNSVRGILATADKLYASLERSGLFEQDLRSGTIRTLHTTDNGRSCYALMRTQNGDLLLGIEKTLWRSSGAKTSTSTPVNFDTWAFCEDNTGKRWLGTASAGLYTLEPDEAMPRACTQYNGFDALASAFILHIEQSPSGMLWVCSNTGFYTVDPKRGVLARYWSGGKDGFYLPAEHFLHVHLDADGVFWFATANGLVRAASRLEHNGDRSPQWDASSGQLFNRANGLSNDFIYAVYEDKQGKLWLPSDHGLICLDKKTEQVRAFLPSDGLTDAEFNRIAHAQGPDGRLYFGGLNGINAFHPDDFWETNNAQSAAPLVLTAFLQLDPATNRIVDRTAELLHKQTIVLHPNDRFFNLELALLTFENPDLIQYAWKIDGLGGASERDSWHYQKERQFNFGGLPYGTHTLRIKAQAADGHWSKQEYVVTIRSLPPWYLRSWFLVLAAALLAIGIRGYILWRHRRQLLEQKKLETMVARATERIEQDKRTIEQQAEELRRLDTMKSRFFANVSHELRTPLTLMLGPVNSMLKSGELSNRNFTYATLIRQNSEQLLGLVGEILDLQKLESGKLELQPKPTLLYPVLKRIAAQFESFAQNKSIAFIFLYRAEKRLQIEVDPAKLELVLNNLLSNAMKYTGAGGRVEFLTEDLAHSIRLTVADTGVGIHPDDLPRVFDRFFQSHQAEAPAEGGTGIGLALVRELSALFGGSVSAQSPGANGTGSTFVFEFPKVEIMGAAEAPAEASPEEQHLVLPAIAPVVPAPQDSEKATILLVEDNLDLRAYLQSLLSENYRVVAVENGQMALDYLLQEIENRKSEPVNLVLSDIMMPVMDGFQLLEKLKNDERFRHIPVIMLTARADMQDKLHALRIGVDDYLLKPFVEEELFARVAALLERYRERRVEPETGLAATDGPDAAGPTAAEEAPRSEYDAAWLASLEKIVAAEVQNDQISVTWIADQLHLSERHFQRRLKTLTGLSPNAYIREVRLQEARRLLEQGLAQTVKEAAWAVSFRDEKYFAQIFRERFGKYPSKVR